MQADGLGQLDNPAATFPRRRGDAGDPYPGVSGNTAFTPRANPAPTKNLDGSFAGFTVDSIRQVVGGGEMAFRLRFGGLTIVRGSDSLAVVQVDGTNFNVFRDLLDDGSAHTVSIADSQVSADGSRRFRFVSWSDGGARSHTITGNLAGRTLTANLTTEFNQIATADVVAQLLGPTAPLSAAQVNSLDSQGNNNGIFDVGDFLAWVKATGAPLSAAVLTRLTTAKGGRP
jgi:hypothetical protein